MTDYERLKQISDEIPKLIEANVTASDPDFQAWQTKVERYLGKIYGEKSIEVIKFTETRFTLSLYVMGTPRHEFVEACQKGLKICQATFRTYLEELSDDCEAEASNRTSTSFSRIFIVHGHNGELKESVARIVEKQDINAIILSEQANQGRTVIEKFENYSDVSGAICLFTADDVGKAKTDSDEQSRARQNVVFETGYFIGKLGRNRIVILANKDVEMPSDLSGVVYTDAANWQVQLLKELRAMGYTVDFNRLF